MKRLSLPPRYQALLTISDVASYLQVSDRTIRRWIGKGRLAAMKVGGQWRLHQKDVDRFVRGLSTDDHEGR